METDNEEEIDIIKTYLKVGKPKIEEKPYYDIDLEKNIILLHDPIFKNPSDKSGIIEVNQIFTNQHEYSYIYDKICQNTIEESLNGDSFIFVSYGITTSEKLDVLIGNIEDSNRNEKHIGIFPRLLEQLINTVNNNKEYKDNLSINLSYMFIYDTKLIDLSNYMGKDFSDYTYEDFVKEGIFIDTVEIIKQVKKIPTENYKDVLFFLNKLLLHIRELEDDSDGNLFTKSHLVIIIYVTNNEGKNVTKLTFILLNGSEQLNEDKQKKLNSKNYISQKQTKNILDLNKMALDSQYTYDSILNAIKNNESIFGKKVLNNQDEDQIDLEEKKNLSRLTKVLFYPCFSRKIKNLKYVIIGSIMPIPGFHSSVKDTLLYLFESKSIKSSIKNVKGRKKTISSKKSDKTNKISMKITEDDTIFNLEQKVKLLQNKISDLNNIIDKKSLNITSLQKNYKKQVEILKEYFGFKGDVNILISGHEFSDEYKCAKEIKDAIDNVRIYRAKIKDLEDKLKKANDEIKRHNNNEEIKINNETMINYFKGAKKIQEEKTNKDNGLYIQIREYQNELKIKDKIIQELQSDLDKKNKIFSSMPKFLKDLHENNKENKEGNESKENQKLNENINNNESIYEEQKSKIKYKKDYILSLADKDKEIKTMKKRYDNILEQKENDILELNKELSLIKNQNLNNISKYGEELIKLNELFMNLINNYQRTFMSNFSKKCNPITLNNKKEHFDKILLSIKEEYNMYSFPLLYNIISKKGILNQNNINSAAMRRASKEYKHIKIKSEKIISRNDLDINLNDLLDKKDSKNKSNDMISINSFQKYLNNEIKNNNINLDYEEIKNESKESILNEYQKLAKFISEIEKKISKINDNTNKNKKKLNISEYDIKIQNYKNRMEKLSESLDKQVSTNNKNQIIINCQNRLIDKLQKDLIFKDKPEFKTKLSKNINRKINLSIEKNYPCISNKNTISKSQNFLNANRGFSAKTKRRIESENSGIATIMNQRTNTTSKFNNTMIKPNAPVRIKTEGNA